MTVPESIVTPTSYVVSCLPEAHPDRYVYTINVQYRGEGQYAVCHGLAFADADGTLSYEAGRPSIDWLDAHRFGLDEALELARRLAATLTVDGRSVADVLAEGVER
jgi:hypothetical protein